MQGDFTRDTFDPVKHYTRVLMQQGRVQLDADWNEQVSILLRYLQALAEDLIGPFGGPADVLLAGGVVIQKYGFGIGAQLDGGGKLKDLSIGGGRYYVQGILCENATWLDANNIQHPSYYTQPDYVRDPKTNPLPTANFLVYLDVWEGLVTPYQDPLIREVALGGPDTADRAKRVWQVKLADNLNIPNAIDGTWNDWVMSKWDGWVQQWQPKQRGRLRAKALEDATQIVEACAVPPDARYRGTENQLYRVEIRTGGTLPNDKPSFIWSRDNGSVIFPIRKLAGNTAYLDTLGRDDRSTLKKDDWVEVVDDAHSLAGEPGPLAQVTDVDPLDMTAVLKTTDGSSLPDYTEGAGGHPLLRRWDYVRRDPSQADIPRPADDGALLIDEGKWLTLEDGIQIWFESPQQGAAAQTYRDGDYWLIPARTATGDVEWPHETDDQGKPKHDPDGQLIPQALPPHGVEHYYAPLAVMIGATAQDVRHQFTP